VVVAVGAIVAVAVLAVATVAGLAWRHWDGRLRRGQPRRQQRLTGSDVGRPLGQRATLLQFSSAFCAPCRAARQLLADVAGRTEGVAHIEVDVADRLDLVRKLDVRRTPTTFILGPDGRIAQRASGVPRRADVLAAVAGAAGPGGPGGPDLGKPAGGRGSDSGHGRA
jgi:thiol-disulfide isomerase/thioredoxin